MAKLFIFGEEIELLKKAKIVDENFDLNTKFTGCVKAFKNYPKNCPSDISPAQLYFQFNWEPRLNDSFVEIAIGLSANKESEAPDPTIYLRGYGWGGWSNWKKII